MALIGGMLVLQLGTNGAPRWLNNRATNWLGVRSYAFYLIHVWIFFEIINVVGADTEPVRLGAILFLVGFPISVGLAGLSWRYVERPCLERRLPWRRGCARRRARPTRCATRRPSPSRPRRRSELRGCGP